MSIAVRDDAVCTIITRVSFSLFIVCVCCFCCVLCIDFVFVGVLLCSRCLLTDRDCVSIARATLCSGGVIASAALAAGTYLWRCFPLVICYFSSHVFFRFDVLMFIVCVCVASPPRAPHTQSLSSPSSQRALPVPVSFSATSLPLPRTPFDCVCC